MCVLSSVLCVVLLAPSLADKPEDLIVGKWKFKEMGKKSFITGFEFAKDGTVKAILNGVPQPWTYKITDGSSLEIQTAKTSKMTFKMEVTKDTLTLTTAKGSPAVFIRE